MVGQNQISAGFSDAESSFTASISKNNDSESWTDIFLAWIRPVYRGILPKVHVSFLIVLPDFIGSIFIVLR
jgi:hypothetical protein